MNITDYISSGILEAYVLGVASEEEQREVLHMATLHPEINVELNAIREALAVHASSFAKTPPAHLKQQIWSNINSLPKTEAKVIDINRTVSKASDNSWLIAASVALLILALATDVYFYTKWKGTEERYTSLLNEKNQLAEQFQVQQANFHETASELAIAVQPGTKMLNLKGVAAFPQALATIFWNNTSKEVYLKVNNLPTVPAGKQYQLWAIVNGAPVDAGVFEVKEAFQKMKQFDNPQAFAVTLEKEGGSPTPSMDQMYVIGNI